MKDLSTIDRADELYDEYLRALGNAQRSCNPIDWAHVGSAWGAWVSQYRKDKRHVLVAAAIADQQNHVVDLTRIIGC